MPEGPELAYSRDRLKKLIEGKSMLEISPGISGRYSKKLPEGYEAFNKLVGASTIKVEEIGTRGKFMWWRLQVLGDPEYWFMHCTYGMSGAWQTKPSKHTAFVVEYGTHKITRDYQHLYFNDARHFGTIKFVRGGAVHRKKLESLGPCILGDSISETLFVQRFRGKKLPIAEALMNQGIVSGIGNYLRAEILYRSRINPWRLTTDMTDTEYSRLWRDSLDTSMESYNSQGASISTYVTPDGTRGAAQFDFKVYGRKKDDDGDEVVRESDSQNRTIHWCPNKQV